jgi:murein DD-endopeptidase MepM/ murein hydrolase activator NlpD
LRIKSSKKQFIIGIAILSVFVLGTGLPMPSDAEASILDKISSLFSNNISYSNESVSDSRSLPLLQAVYNASPDYARGGDALTIRDGAVLASSFVNDGTITRFKEGNADNGHINIYIVRENDTLGTIAEKFGVSVNTIRWANDIKRSQSIRVGQEMVILPVTGVRYVVKNGGTLRDIIKKTGGSLDEASEYNAIDPDEILEKGVVVIVPNGEVSSPKPVQRVRKLTKKRHVAKRRVTSKAHNVSNRYLPGYFTHPLAHKGVKTQGIHGYNAVDIGARVGTPIVAAASGKVILARPTGWNGGYGRYTIIKHSNGTQTVYAHMSKNISYVGQKAVKGQVIGYVGNTGRSTGPHLHFEVRGAKNPF